MKIHHLDVNTIQEMQIGDKVLLIYYPRPAIARRKIQQSVKGKHALAATELLS
jgi:hypothetical protein